MPSADLSAMLPAKPSVAITSTVPAAMSSASTKPWNLIGRPESRSVAAAVRMVSEPFSSSVPMLSRPTVGSRTPRTLRAKTSPITANCASVAESQSILAPRSSITLSPRTVGKTDPIAGRPIPGRVLSVTLASAMSAPVLPAETTPSAVFSPTASMASRMLDAWRWRNTWTSLSLSAITFSAWWTVLTDFRRLNFAKPRSNGRLLAEELEAELRMAHAGDVGAPDHHVGSTIATHCVEGDYDLRVAHLRAFVSAWYGARPRPRSLRGPCSSRRPDTRGGAACARRNWGIPSG